MVIYGQRTADDRIAFGGRGVPYLYGSRISPSVERHHRSHERIHRTLVDLFPALSGARITHRWGGVLGVTRNWTPFVHFDRAAGTAGAGGYVGEGVSPSNLAGRTLADLITGTDSERVDLPWVGVRHRRWEPEPLRWLGVRGSRWIWPAPTSTNTAPTAGQSRGRPWPARSATTDRLGAALRRGRRRHNLAHDHKR